MVYVLGVNRTSMEKAAGNILTRAVELDKSCRFTEALVCYQEGLQMLLENYRGLPPGRKKDTLKEKMDEYISRAEHIKKIICEKKEAGSYHEEIQVSENSKGYSYEMVMGRFMDADVDSIQIEDPYIRNYNQFCNLLHFCELAVRKCVNLKMIKLKTSYDVNNKKEQETWIQTLSEDLINNHGIQLQVEFSTTLHDRKIIFSTGWIVKCGRGLDYFKPPLRKNGLGKFDLNFRPCRETKIDIYHQKNTLQK